MTRFAPTRDVIAASGISATVYGLRVASIVLRSLFPIVAAFLVLKIDRSISDLLLYLCFAVSVIGMLTFLSVEFHRLPRSVLGMAAFIVNPFLSLWLYWVTSGTGWKEGFVFMTAQTLLTIVLIAWHVYEGKKDPMGPFLIGIAVASIVAIAVSVASLLHNVDPSFLSGKNAPITIPLVFAIVAAIIEARNSAAIKKIK